MGFYLIEVDEREPDKDEPSIMINWKNKLDIEDTNMFYQEITDQKSSHLVVSYKSIYINTFNVMVICLHQKSILYRFESYHLWEINIGGILLQNNDFIIFDKDGMSIMNLGTQDKKTIKGLRGYKSVLHSLNSCCDLKLEESNHIMFHHGDEGTIITVQDLYEDKIGDIHFEKIFKLKV